MMTKWDIVGRTTGLCLVAACVIEFVFCRRRRNWEVNNRLNALMDRARSCETEELDALSIDVADYASGLIWNTRKQKTKIVNIIWFINGRQRQFRHELIARSLARSKGTAAPPPGQSPNPGEAARFRKLAGQSDPPA